MVEDGYDRRVAHRKESGLVQDSGAQQFHGPHPECWQSLMDVDGAAGNKNADELALAGHHAEAHAGIFTDLLDFAKEILTKYSYQLERDLSENLASATSGQPGNLQPSRRITAEVGCGSSGCRLSWPWAHLQNDLDHVVPESIIARREAAQIQAYEPPRSHWMHYTEMVWRQLGALFLE